MSANSKIAVIVNYAQVFASIAQVVTLLFVWFQVQDIRKSLEGRERPALVFSKNVKVELIKHRDGFALRYTVEAENQGSGIAYDVKWREANQIPPLHSHFMRKEDALNSVQSCSEAFEATEAPSQRIVIGPGLSQLMIFDEGISQLPRPGDLRGTKYIAAFYESDTRRKNASVVSVSYTLSPQNELWWTADDTVLCGDPREAVRGSK